MKIIHLKHLDLFFTGRQKERTPAAQECSRDNSQEAFSGKHQVHRRIIQIEDVNREHYARLSIETAAV